MSNAVLRITDGTNHIDFVQGAEAQGFFLEEWTPAIAGYKGGGTYKDSPMADGKRLTQRVFDNATEVFTVKARHSNQDTLIRETQDLRRLLEKAADYWCSDWQDEPVWLEAKGRNETNTRYAIVMSGKMETDDNPYSGAFFQRLCKAAMDGLTIAVERGHWQNHPPTEYECQEIAAYQNWSPDNWAVRDNAPTTIVYDIIRLANGYLLACETNIIYRSTDNGVTWPTATVSPTGIIYCMAQALDGDIFAASADGIWRSQDNGDNWASMTAARNTHGPNTLIVDENGVLWLVDEGSGIYSSNDDGANWTARITGLAEPTSCMSIFRGSTAYYLGIYSLGPHSIALCPNPLTTAWTLCNTYLQGLKVYSFYEPGDGYIYAGCNSLILRNLIASDPTTSIEWATSSTGFTAEIWDFFQDILGTYYATGSANILESQDMIVWASRSIGAATLFYTLNSSVAGTYLYAGENGDIWVKRLLPLSMGIETPTCNDQIYTANKHNQANITHIKVFDATGAGSYTTIFSPVPTVLPWNLLAPGPEIGDITYFGCDTTVTDSGPFSSLVLDIGTAGTGYTIVWKYCTNPAGPVFSTLTVQDNTVNTGIVFGNTGVNSVHWRQPSNWVIGAVDGVTGYWISAEVTAIPAALTIPTQQNRYIYSVVWPFVEIDELDIVGDIPAGIKMENQIQSDKSGPGAGTTPAAITNLPNLYDNRLICGLRTYNRGITFSAFLNCSNEQNPAGVTCSAGTNTTFLVVGTDATIVRAVTGVCTLYNPTALETMANRTTFVLSTSVARDYYGTFHCFLRCQQTFGTPGDIGIRLVINTGSGGVTYTGETKYLTTLNDNQLIDFGQINIPASSVLKYTEIGDQAQISIQASAASGTPNLYMYDLILIPTDEWAGDFVDGANTTDSTLENGKYLEVDSISYPKYDRRSIIKNVGSDFVSTIWENISSGPAMLQANKKQRLWFLSARYYMSLGTMTSAGPDTATLTDTAASFINEGVVPGMTVFNTTDGTSSLVIAVTGATTLTTSGITWNANDVYYIITNNMISEPYVCHSIQIDKVERYLSMRGDR